MSHSILRWLRIHLFNSAGNALLSAILLVLCGYVLHALANWALHGAQWSVVTDSMRVLMAGTYPADQIWRPAASAMIIVALSAATLGVLKPMPFRHSLAAGVLLLILVAAGAGSSPILLHTALGLLIAVASWRASTCWAGLRKSLPALWMIGIIALCVLMSAAGTERWGGLLVSVLVTILGAVFSLPLGILLAFGRRSRQPSLRWLSTLYIETMRAMPLILVVYCLWTLMPLIVPSWNTPDLARGILGFSLFFAAYVAEYIRSGLQSVSRGQIEAAQSLGMRPWHINRDIVLPQATRVATPALVGNVLDIFNNVPLLFVIGMTDFLRAGQMVLLSPQAGGRTYEIYLFMFVVYMLIASVLTYGSRRLEALMNQDRR